MLTLAALAAFSTLVPNGSLLGKVMCGYQGWFTAPGDGTGIDWFHYARKGKFEPGSSNIEYWPDTRELGSDEKFATPFQLKDGSTAYVYSANNPKTVDRHFEWMERYGLDGVFVQRFGSDLRSPDMNRFRTNVLKSCRAGAERHGRLFAVMYDLSGLNEGETSIVRNDWKRLRDELRLTESSRYLRDHGKPVVALWGIGFNDHRRYTLKECADLISFLKDDPTYGGCEVMVGVPTYWRTGDRDAVSDPDLLPTILKADVVSPWAVGRFGTPEAAADYARTTLKGDVDWCAAHGKAFMPVAFPGFSWHNMNPGSPQNQIPRLRGRFLESQFAAYRSAGAQMLYVAMFDEMDEGTAIFKCTNDTPAGASHFLDYEGLPSDAYLQMVGDETTILHRTAPGR